MLYTLNLHNVAHQIYSIKMLCYCFEFYNIDIVRLIGLLNFVIHCDFFLILDNYSLSNLILYL